MFQLMLKDNQKARWEDETGCYRHVRNEDVPLNSQEELYEEAYERAAVFGHTKMRFIRRVRG